ncbi:hypothetical protein ZHAS_00005792 [Anopheles sinensis]|uniref:Uncharacterized protein n=1 Tax=Anopheles sinensis TaxID=74873 RepID=A0A084VKD5_ANOSI|nr:hypothetical protein ZHAS_00005792 [Anopheles sinensis]
MGRGGAYFEWNYFRFPNFSQKDKKKESYTFSSLKRSSNRSISPGSSPKSKANISLLDVRNIIDVIARRGPYTHQHLAPIQRCLMFSFIFHFAFHTPQVSFFLSSYVVPLSLISFLYMGMLVRLWKGAPGGRASAESR